MTVNRKEDGYKCVVNDEGAKPYSKLEIMTVRHRALFLIKAYLIAIEKMNLVSFLRCREEGKFVSRKEATQNLFTWEDCCDAAVKDLNALGIETFTTVQSLNKLHRKFRESKVLIPKNRNRSGGVDYLQLFDHYPLMKSMIVDFVEKNKKRMSAKILQDEVGANILPTVLRHAEANGDINSTEYKLLSKVTGDPPKEHSILKWISFLGLKYDKHYTRRGKEWAAKKKEENLLYYSNPENRLQHSLRMKEYYRHNPQNGGKLKQPTTPNSQSDNVDDNYDTY
mmetsp:Transcript_12953/g.23352  ORF Transcript_12953/g.23352 Transcript_12953/m.23352 type:complete len:281 (-) Transcript_12953:55-897(-)